MHVGIEDLVTQFEAGHLSRRQLVAHIAAWAALLASAGPEPAAAQPGTEATFKALELNHLALRVTDLDRSQRFYEQHLGMKLIPMGERALAGMRFMACGPHVLNLFRAASPGMDHVCFTVAGYDPKAALEKLRAKGLAPEQEGERTYFPDPDGFKLQVGGPEAGGQRLASRGSQP